MGQEQPSVFAMMPRGNIAAFLVETLLALGFGKFIFADNVADEFDGDATVTRAEAEGAVVGSDGERYTF